MARNSTPCIAFLDTDADDTLTKWMLKLVEEYNDIPGLVSTLK